MIIIIICIIQKRKLRLQHLERLPAGIWIQQSDTRDGVCNHYMMLLSTRRVDEGR